MMSLNMAVNCRFKFSDFDIVAFYRDYCRVVQNFKKTDKLAVRFSDAIL